MSDLDKLFVEMDKYRPMLEDLYQRWQDHNRPVEMTDAERADHEQEIADRRDERDRKAIEEVGGLEPDTSAEDDQEEVDQLQRESEEAAARAQRESDDAAARAAADQNQRDQATVEEDASRTPPDAG